MNIKKNALLLFCITTSILILVCIAHQVERGFGKSNVDIVEFEDSSGVSLTAKLYRPLEASPENKMPAILALHGFQNDKETETAFAIEFARRGFVVLALDEFGHGNSGGRMTTEDKTLGGNSAFRYLKELPYVDVDNIGVMGHSMGAASTLAVATKNPDHKALNPKCGGAGNPKMNNLLLTQARFEEFQGSRENEPRSEGLTTHPKRLAGFGVSEKAAWDVTYGNFSDGSARMQTLIDATHPGTTHNAKAVTVSLEWMQKALKQGRADEYWISADSHIYWWKEICTLLALLLTVIALIPTTNLLLALRFFKPVINSKFSTQNADRKSWSRMALVNTLIAGISYPLFAGIGGYTLNLIIPGLKMVIANGVMIWFIGNILIYLVVFSFWYRKNKKQYGLNFANLGLTAGEGEATSFKEIISRTFILGALLFLYMYLLVSISQNFLGIEFRFLWPFMRQFTLSRFGYFWIYFFPALFFFIFNGGLFLFGQARQKEYSSEIKTQVIWWLKNCFAGIAGLGLIWAFQYVPFLYLGLAPGFELIGLNIFSGMIPLLLDVFIPEFIILFFMLTWFFRKTGRVYLGAVVVASIATWFMTAGTAIV